MSCPLGSALIYMGIVSPGGTALFLVWGIRKKAHLCEPLEYSVGESNPYCKIENLEY